MNIKYKIIGISIFTLIVFILSLTFADNLITYLQAQTGLSFVAQAPSEGLLNYLNVAFVITFIAILPFLTYLLISYVKPALYNKEKEVLNKLLSLTHLSIGLFIIGVFFGGLMMFKVIIPYLTGFNTFVGYQNLYKASEIIMFILMSIFYCGLIFQVPIVNYYLLEFKILKVKNIKTIRGVTIIGALIIGSIMTPPDVLSQIIFSLPIWLLFEISTIVWRYKNDRTNRNINYNRSNCNNSNVW